MFFKKEQPITINPEAFLESITVKYLGNYFIIEPVESLNEKKYSFLIKKLKPAAKKTEEIIAFGREKYFTVNDARKAAFSYILDDCILNN